MTRGDIRKQLDRMSHARAWQAAQPNEILTIGGALGFSVELPDQADDMHWDVVKELVHRAKVEGYASRVVDDAFLYVALYDDVPLTWPPSAPRSEAWWDRMRDDLIASGIFYPDPEQNALWFGSTEHEVEGEYQPYIFPFFLFGLPVETVIDLLWRRLVIIVFVNLGRLVEALRAAGLDARLPADDGELHRDGIPISATIDGADGVWMSLTLGGMYRYTQRIFDRFLSLDGYVRLICQIVDSAKEARSKDIGRY
jgi:hypothetical protein